MSDLLSGQISFSGLGSGTDFTSIVDQLVKVESMSLNRMEGQKDTYERRIDAVDDIIKVMEEAKNTLAKLSSRDNFVKKNVAFTDTSFASGEASSDAIDGNYRLEVISVAERSSAMGAVEPGVEGKDKVYTSKDDKLAYAGDFTYSIKDENGDMVESTIKVTENMTLEQLKHAVNGDENNPGIEMVLNDNGQGNVGISFRSKETGANQEIVIADTYGNTGGSKWNVLGIGFDNTNKGTDASYEIDGLSMTSSSNKIAVADGVDVEFYEAGTTTISVKTDVAKVQENIQEFLNAVNSVIKEIDRHTNLDEIAEEDKSDDDAVSDALESYFGSSGETSVKYTENALTGESGITALDSRIANTLSALGLGFERVGPNGKGGDLVGSFAEMGIKINTVEGDPNFGLFEIGPASSTGSTEIQNMDLERFEDYTTNHIEDVIDFFVADNKIETSSTGFFYESSIESMLEPGIYDVSYEVDIDGNIIEHGIDADGNSFGGVYINGVLAERDGANPRLYTASQESGGIKGLAIQISESDEGVYNESIKVQQGKINQITDMFSTELTPYVPPDVADGYFPENGAMAILRNGYDETMESLDDQLFNEEARLATWETRKRMEFARLETLLSEYNNISTSMEAQIASMM